MRLSYMVHKAVFAYFLSDPLQKSLLTPVRHVIRSELKIQVIRSELKMFLNKLALFTLDNGRL